jgi:hypothetical protein
MPIPTYVPGYPPDGSSLGQTKSTIRNNLDGTFQTLAVDHINNNGQPGSQPPGYHTVIHQVPQASVSTVTGYNQVFSGVPGTLSVNAVTTPAIPANSDQQLYSLTGGGVLSQLTGHNAATNGYQWIGGVLLQWGIVSSLSSTGTVTFATSNVSFPNNCFNIQMTLIAHSGGTSSSNTGAPITGTISKNAFNYSYTGSSSYVGFYWLAIGN